MTTSDSSDTSSAMTGTSSPAAAATASAVAAAAKPAEQVAQSVSAAAAPSQPQGNSHGQSESSQHVPPATPQARQSAGTVLDSLESCKPGRKRKAADMFDGCRPDDAAGMHPATVQMTQPCQGQTLASSPEAERLSAACHRAQLVESGGPEHVIAPTVGGRSAAGNSVQQDVEASRAEAADCAGQQEPLHIACMQILAGAVADCLDRPSGQDASTGEPALHVCQHTCATLVQRCFCRIASAVLLLIGRWQNHFPLHCLLMLSVSFRSGRSYHPRFGISATRGSSGCVGNDESVCATNSRGVAAASPAASRR